MVFIYRKLSVLQNANYCSLRWFIDGVTSFGNGCGPRNPKGNAQVDAFFPFISETVSNDP